MYRHEVAKDPLGFTQVPNTPLRDTSLSLKAKGLYSVMLQLPVDWKFSVAGLAAICKECTNTIRSALNELEKAGLLNRHRVRGKGGVFDSICYTFFFSAPRCKNSLVDKSPVGKPPVEICQQTKTEGTNKKEVKKQVSPLSSPKQAGNQKGLFASSPTVNQQRPARQGRRSQQMSTQSECLRIDYDWDHYRLARDCSPEMVEKYFAPLIARLGRERVVHGEITRSEFDNWYREAYGAGM